MDIMRQFACLIVNLITVYSFGFLFNCTTANQASNSMTALTNGFNRLVGACLASAFVFGVVLYLLLPACLIFSQILLSCLVTVCAATRCRLYLDPVPETFSCVSFRQDGILGIVMQ